MNSTKILQRVAEGENDNATVSALLDALQEDYNLSLFEAIMRVTRELFDSQQAVMQRWALDMIKFGAPNRSAVCALIAQHVGVSNLVAVRFYAQPNGSEPQLEETNTICEFSKVRVLNIYFGAGWLMEHWRPPPAA